MSNNRNNRQHYRQLAILSLIILLIPLSGCAGENAMRASGGQHLATSPTIITHSAPPHGPRHGYRHRHHNHSLFFDSSVGAYIVINTPGVYFSNGHFLRFYNNGWQFSNQLGQHWQPAHHDHIPHALRQAQHHNRHDNQHNSVGHSPNNHGHRRQHDGHDLIFDSAVGAYFVLNQPGIYFHNNRYFRHHRGTWQSANHLNDSWRAARHKDVPHKLKKNKHKKKHANKDKHNKHYKKH
ncbi:MAG: hypothetical protein COB30_011365 [Ectothiorhodospiraceae bacterium]|nr:hypothetical protein [Ectothiorhodospiraceae bacterium]